MLNIFFEGHFSTLLTMNIYGSGILKITELENVIFKAKLEFFLMYVYIKECQSLLFFEGRFSTLLTIFLEHLWVRNPKNNRIGKCQI